ncbi:MAG: hypothetical protein ACRDZN_12170 [Acidimicrobiales bacterium]
MLADLITADDPPAGIAEGGGPQREQLVDMVTRTSPWAPHDRRRR